MGNCKSHVTHPHPFPKEYISSGQQQQPQQAPTHQTTASSSQCSIKNYESTSSIGNELQGTPNIAVQHTGHAIEFVSSDMKNDEAVKNCSTAPESASPKLQNNEEVKLTTVQSDQNAFGLAPPKMRNKSVPQDQLPRIFHTDQRQIIPQDKPADTQQDPHPAPRGNHREHSLDTVHLKGKVLDAASSKAQTEVVLASIQNNPLDAVPNLSFARAVARLGGNAPSSVRLLDNAHFRLAAPEFQNDKDKKNWIHWMSMVRKDGCNLQHAPTQMRNNKTIVHAAVRQNWKALEYASPMLQKDVSVFIEALKQNGLCLSNVSDASLVIEAVKRNGLWLEFASLEFRNNVLVVTEAVNQNGLALQYVSPELRGDSSIVTEAVKQKGVALQCASPELRGDSSVVTEAVRQNGLALQYASPELRGDTSVVMEAVKQKGLALEYVSPELQGDASVVLEAIKNSEQALEYASPELQNFASVIMRASKRNSFWALDYLSDEKKKDRHSVVQDWIERVQIRGLNLQHAPNFVRNEKQVVIAAIKSNANAIKYAPDNLKRDREVLIAAGMFDEHHSSRFTTDITSYKCVKDEMAREMVPKDDDAVILTPTTKRIALSTRFSLNQSSKSEATNFTKLFKSHDYIKNGDFKIYAPNAFNKNSCDPNWTDFSHPCRGTKETCQFDDTLKTGHPTDESCWRYSYRYHLHESKSSDGFMIQLIESNTSTLKKAPPKLGNGQQIERHMAQGLGLKIFHVYRPINYRFAGGCEWYFNSSHIEIVVLAIKSWYQGGCRDMTECIIRP